MLSFIRQHVGKKIRLARTVKAYEFGPEVSVYAGKEGLLYGYDATPPAAVLLFFGKDYLWTDARNLEGAPQGEQPPVIRRPLPEPLRRTRATHKQKPVAGQRKNRDRLAGLD